MAKKDEVEHEPLTEEQRITALESRVGTNKIVLLVVALLLIVVISVSVTAFTLSAMGDDIEVVSPETVAALEAELKTLQASHDAQAQELKSLKKLLPVIEDQLENTSNIKLLNIITEQEAAHQDFLETLRSGMYDLAHMLPGSRTWLEVYGEKVEQAQIYSRDREKALKLLTKGAASGGEEDMW